MISEQLYYKTSFDADILRGKDGEKIFSDDFLDFLNIQYVNVTGIQGYRVIDSDFLAKTGLYEVKSNYRDDKQIIIEEYTNYNTNFGSISYGWYYKSKANMLVFISKDTRTMIFIPFTDGFKRHYETIKNKYQLRLNSISHKGNSKWQSAFRKIPLEAISGYFAYYKRVNF